MSKNSIKKCISTTEEVWKDIPGYEGYYQVSNMGRVKSLTRVIQLGTRQTQTITGRFIKLRTQQMRGYKEVELNKFKKAKYFLVHRLVLEAFIGPCPERMECCHKDNNPDNNKLQNLRWDTREANVQDKMKVGITSAGCVGNTWKLKKRTHEVIEKWLTREYTIKELAKMFDVHMVSIFYILRKYKKSLEDE